MGFFNLFGKNISIDEGVAQFNEEPDAILLDVRTSEEYVQGHIPRSVNLPVDQIQNISYPKGTKLFVYCHSGPRSSSACTWLNKNGYTAINIGGIVQYHGVLER